MTLTVRAIQGLGPNKEIRDSEVRGLAIRRQTHSINFYFLWERHGKAHRLRLGTFPVLKLEDARDIARGHRAMLDKGGIPGVTISGAATVADLLDLYDRHLRDTAKRPDQVKALLDKHVRPEIGILPLPTLKRKDVQHLVDKLRRKSKSVAGAVGRYITAAMVFGEKRGHVEHAIRNLDLPPNADSRKRVLNDAELKALMPDWLPRGLDGPARSAFGAIFALCLLTGARRSEIAELRWHEIGLNSGLITLSPERSKGGRETYVVLSSFALRILNSWPRFDDEIVFPTERPRAVPSTGGTRPGRSGRGFVTGFSRAVADSQERTKTEGWTSHDLRRTAGTRLHLAGVPDDHIKSALNHSKGRLFSTYAVEHPVEIVREALEAWGDSLVRMTLP